MELVSRVIMQVMVYSLVKPYGGKFKQENQTTNFCGIGYFYQDDISNRMIQTLPLVDKTLLLNAKKCCLKSITTMLCTYKLKTFVGHIKYLKVDDDGVTPMKKFPRTTIGITLKN